MSWRVRPAANLEYCQFGQIDPEIDRVGVEGNLEIQ